MVAAAAARARSLVGIGATRYTPLGESTYLEVGDEAIVRVYDTDSAVTSELRQLVWEP